MVNRLLPVKALPPEPPASPTFCAVSPSPAREPLAPFALPGKRRARPLEATAQIAFMPRCTAGRWPITSSQCRTFG
jgi:hypothetical protein